MAPEVCLSFQSSKLSTSFVALWKSKTMGTFRSVHIYKHRLEKLLHHTGQHLSPNPTELLLGGSRGLSK